MCNNSSKRLAMNQSLTDLYQQQGRLLERSAAQRAALLRQLTPLTLAAQRTDLAVATLQRSVLYLKSHPLPVLLAVLGLVLLKPQRAWRWAASGWSLWRLWQRLRS